MTYGRPRSSSARKFEQFRPEHPNLSRSVNRHRHSLAVATVNPHSDAGGKGEHLLERPGHDLAPLIGAERKTCIVKADLLQPQPEAVAEDQLLADPAL